MLRFPVVLSLLLGEVKDFERIGCALGDLCVAHCCLTAINAWRKTFHCAIVCALKRRGGGIKMRTFITGAIIVTAGLGTAFQVRDIDLAVQNQRVLIDRLADAQHANYEVTIALSDAQKADHDLIVALSDRLASKHPAPIGYPVSTITGPGGRQFSNCAMNGNGDTECSAVTIGPKTSDAK